MLKEEINSRPLFLIYKTEPLISWIASCNGKLDEKEPYKPPLRSEYRLEFIALTKYPELNVKLELKISIL